MTVSTETLRTQPVTDAAQLRKATLWICAVGFLAGWLPRLFWGFWTDEAGTYWMAAEGWSAAVSRSWNFAGQSVLYGVIEALLATGASPWMEMLLRLPSVLAMVVAAWQLHHIAERRICAGAGWTAVAIFACTPDVFEFGTSARPYALALAASVSSFRYLLDWEDASRGATLLKYLIASVFVTQFHYLFGFVFVVQALYIAVRWIRGRRIRLALPLSAAVLLPLSLLPLLGQLRLTAQKAAGFSNAEPPAFAQLGQAIAQPMLLIPMALGAGLLALSARKLHWQPVRTQSDAALLAVLWLVLGPVVFFFVARATGQSVFASRYLLFTVPPVILLATWAVAGLSKPEWRMVVLVAILGGTIFHPGRLVLAFKGSPSSWREPLAAAASLPGPLFVTSGMIDSNSVDWSVENPASSYLFGALAAYPVPNRTLPLPYALNEDAQHFVRKQVSSAPEERYLLVAAADAPLIQWMQAYMTSAGYTAQAHPVNDYTVLEFKRFSEKSSR